MSFTQRLSVSSSPEKWFWPLASGCSSFSRSNHRRLHRCRISLIVAAVIGPEPSLFSTRFDWPEEPQGLEDSLRFCDKSIYRNLEYDLGDLDQSSQDPELCALSPRGNGRPKFDLSCF